MPKTEVKDNSGSGKRVCKYCYRKFNNGRALGGHIRTHYNTTKSSNNKTQRRVSSSPPHANTSTYNLPGWKVHKKRGSNQVRNKEVIEANTEKSQEKATNQEYSSIDGDEKGFSMMKRLKLEFELSDSNHKISARPRNRYVCLTCNMVFPTFHGVHCHVYQNLNSSPAKNADDEDVGEGHKFGEECGNNSSDSINQAVVTSNPPRMLDFDLNELPPMEDEE